MQKYDVSVGFAGGVGVSWVSGVRRVGCVVVENLDGEGMDSTVKLWSWSFWSLVKGQENVSHAL